MIKRLFIITVVQYSTVVLLYCMFSLHQYRQYVKMLDKLDRDAIPNNPHDDKVRCPGERCLRHV